MFIKKILGQVFGSENDASNEGNALDFDGLFKKAKEKRAKINQELPYDLYDKETGIFYNTNSIGFGLKMLPLGGANDEIVVQLNKILCSLPEGDDWVYHFNLKCTNRVGETIEKNHVANAKLGGIHALFAENESIYAQYASKHGFKTKENAKFDLRQYEASLFVTNTKNKKMEMIDVRENLKTSLDQINMPNIDYEPRMLLAHVNNVLNYSHSAKKHPSFPYNELEPLNIQSLAKDSEFLVHDSNIECQFTNDRFKKEDCSIVTYGLQQLPHEFHLYRLSNCFADLFTPSRAIPCPFEINVTFKIGDEAKESLANDGKINSCNKWLSAPMILNKDALQEEKADRELLRKGLLSQDTKVCRMSFSVTLFTTKETFKKDKISTENAFQKESLRIIPNDLMHHVILLSSLPFMGAEFFKDLYKMGLVRTVKTSNLVNFLPVTGDPSSNKLGLLLPTFRRTAYYFDPFTAGGDNFNIAVSAGSGAGKSFFVQALIKNTVERNGVCWILDKGDSYKKLTKLYNGVYLNHKNIFLNPFTHLKTISKGGSFKDEETGELINPLSVVIADITSLFMIIAGADSKDGLQKTAFKLAIERAYNKHQSNTLVDHIKVELEEIARDRDDRVISNLAFQLLPFCEGAIHGDIFNKPSKLDPKIKLTTLELDGFKGDLLQPVVFALMVNITQAMYLSGDRQTPKIALIEEAWKLMSGENKDASEFIEEGYRTARKFKGAFCTVTQSVADYKKSSASEACYNNADIHILLKQGSGFKRYLADNPTEFTPFEQLMLKNFQAVKNVGYSSMMLRVSGQVSYHRFFADPYTRALLSTEADEVQYLDELTMNNVPIEKAVRQTAEKYYGEEIKAFEEIKAEVLREQEENELAFIA